MARTRVGLFLTKEEETKLEEWCQERTTSTRLQFRAAIVLEHARGDSVEEIAKRHQTSERTVLRWRQRFANNRLAGLVAKQVSTVSRKAGGSVAGGGKAVAGKLADAGAALAKKAADAGGVIADAGVAGAKKAADVGGVIADVGVAGAKKAADVGGVIADVGVAGAKKAADVGGVIADAGMAGAKKAADVGGVIADAGMAGAKKAADVGGVIADAGVAGAKKAADVGGVIADAGVAGAKKAADVGGVIADAGAAGAKMAAGAAIWAAEAMQAGFRKTLDTTLPLANWLSATAQGLLASNLANDLNGLLQDMVKGPANIYDKAMDAVYNETHIGGGLHRMFDGGHTIGGAFKAAHGASAEDGFLQEVFGTILGLLRDVTTPGGLPLGTWSEETYDSVAGWLQSHFHIPRSWFSDLLTYDAAELIGGAIGVIALALAWNGADTETFAKLVGSMGLSAAITANPLLLVIVVVALAKAYNKARETGAYTTFVDGLLKGGFTAGATLCAVALVGAVGGPAGVALLVGLVAGMLAANATENISVTDIGDFVVKGTTDLATEVKEMAERGREWWPQVTARGLQFSWRPIG